jgi:hypothetical protein
LFGFFLVLIAAPSIPPGLPTPKGTGARRIERTIAAGFREKDLVHHFGLPNFGGEVTKKGYSLFVAGFEDRDFD